MLNPSFKWDKNLNSYLSWFDTKPEGLQTLIA